MDWQLPIWYKVLQIDIPLEWLKNDTLFREDQMRFKCMEKYSYKWERNSLLESKMKVWININQTIWIFHLLLSLFFCLNFIQLFYLDMLFPLHLVMKTCKWYTLLVMHSQGLYFSRQMVQLRHLLQNQVLKHLN